MQSWEGTKMYDEDPINQYKLSKKAIKDLGESECKKGIGVNGITLTLDWKSIRNVEDKVRDFLVKHKGKEGLVDMRIYMPNSKKIIETYILE